MSTNGELQIEKIIKKGEKDIGVHNTLANWKIEGVYSNKELALTWDDLEVIPHKKISPNNSLNKIYIHNHLDIEQNLDHNIERRI